jgi:hypothetical protein
MDGMDLGDKRKFQKKVKRSRYGKDLERTLH